MDSWSFSRAWRDVGDDLAARDGDGKRHGSHGRSDNHF